MLFVVFLKFIFLAFTMKVTANTHNDMLKLTTSRVPVQSESSKDSDKYLLKNVGERIIFDVTNGKQYNEIYNATYNTTIARMSFLYLTKNCKKIRLLWSFTLKYV